MEATIVDAIFIFFAAMCAAFFLYGGWLCLRYGGGTEDTVDKQPFARAGKVNATRWWRLWAGTPMVLAAIIALGAADAGAATVLEEVMQDYERGDLAANADSPRLVRLIVPANGSGIPLVIAHMLARKTRQAHHLTVVVEFNEPRSPDTVVERFASAPSDGKTLLVLSRAMQMTFAAEGRGALGGLAPVVGLAAMPYLIVCPFEAPARTMSELILLAEKRKGDVSYGTAGGDHPARIAGEMLNKTNALSMRHAAFDRTFTALAAVMRGKVSVAIEAAPAALPYVRTRRLLGVATTSKDRLAAAPLRLQNTNGR